MRTIHLIKYYKYEVCTDEVNKIALSANDNKMIVYSTMESIHLHTVLSNKSI